MSTMISVIGKNHTGKTSFAIMLAHALTKEIPAAPHIQIRGSSNKGELFQMAKINSFKNE